MRNVGVLYHPGRSDSAALAERVDTLLRAEGKVIWRGAVDHEDELATAAPDLDMLVTLGGDGTIVKAVRAVASACVPVLGVNLGRLGFLAEVEPEDIEHALKAVVAGEYAVEKRMMLRADLYRDNELLGSYEAINDAVIGRGAASRAVRIAVEVDGHYVMTQTADAVIVSTPTGSTAYCLAAGGPIVAPDVDCLTLTPVAAHLSMAHSIVVPAYRCVRLRLVKGQNPMLTIDGQVDVDLESCDEVRSTASVNKALFVRFGSDGYFYETVLRRLRWPDRGPTP